MLIDIVPLAKFRWLIYYEINVKYMYVR
jgi:hypothetical protein